MCRVSIVIDKDLYGFYAFSPEIEGCQAQGASLEEVIEQMTKTIRLYLIPPAEKTFLKLPA